MPGVRKRTTRRIKWIGEELASGQGSRSVPCSRFTHKLRATGSTGATPPSACRVDSATGSGDNRPDGRNDRLAAGGDLPATHRDGQMVYACRHAIEVPGSIGARLPESPAGRRQTTIANLPACRMPKFNARPRRNFSMSPCLRRLSLAAALGSLLAVAGCESSPQYDQYDRPYDGSSYGRQPSYDRNDGYDRGYRDAQRQQGYNRSGGHDYERGYERGRQEAERENKRAAKEERREREARDARRQQEDQRRSYDYRRPADVRPRSVPAEQAPMGVNDG